MWLGKRMAEGREFEGRVINAVANSGIHRLSLRAAFTDCSMSSLHSFPHPIHSSQTKFLLLSSSVVSMVSISEDGG